MSVRQCDRKQGKLEVLVQARKLCAYSIEILSNKKNFPEIYDETFTNKLADCLLDIFIKAVEANDIMVGKNKDKWDDRSKKQKESITKCSDALALIAVAQSLFHLRESRYQYWIGQVIYVRQQLRKWHESDCDRYKGL